MLRLFYSAYSQNIMFFKQKKKRIDSEINIFLYLRALKCKQQEIRYGLTFFCK